MAIIKGGKEGSGKFPESFKTKSALFKKDDIAEKLPEKESEKTEVLNQPSEGSSDEAVLIPSSDHQARMMAEGPREEFTDPDAVEPQVYVNIEEALNKAKEEADKILLEAKNESRKLLKESQLYCTSAFSQSERDGFVQGREEGLKQGKLDVVEHVKEAKSIIEQAVKERELLIHGSEPELARLSIEIAQKIIGRELSQDKDTILGIVKEAMKKIKTTREHVLIKVNSENYETVLNNKDIYAKMVEGLKNIEVVQDNKIEPGGVMIETNLGNIDARIETQLETLRIAFKDVQEYEQ